MARPLRGGTGRLAFISFSPSLLLSFSCSLPLLFCHSLAPPLPSSVHSPHTQTHTSPSPSTTPSDLILNVSVRSPLTEAAEVHLLEASSQLTSLPTTDATTGAQQLELLQKMIAVLAHQVQVCLASVPADLSQCPEPVLEALAHRLQSLSALAKSFKARTHPQAVLLFAPSAGLVTTVIAQCGSSALIRSRVCQFLHRMVHTLGLPVCDLLAHPSCFPLLLAFCEASEDTDEAVEVILNVINQNKEQALPLADHVLPYVVTKYRDLLLPLEHELGISGAAQRATVNVSPDPCASSCPVLLLYSPPLSRHSPSHHGLDCCCRHLTPETHTTHAPSPLSPLPSQSHYLQFLHSVSATGCHEALLSPANSSMLEHIFKGVLLGLQGGGPILGLDLNGAVGAATAAASAGMPLRKYALLILTALAVPWSRPPTPPNLTEALRSFLLTQAIPSILADLTDRAVLDVNDAATHNLLTDVGALLWTVATGFGPQSCAEALATVLQQPGVLRVPWSGEALQALCQAVVNPGPQINTFKDQFKRFVKNLMGGSGAGAGAGGGGGGRR